jgi:hypothetical protein
MGQAKEATRYCEACGRPARGRFCEAHHKRVQRGRSLGESITEAVSPYERALAAWVAHIDAADDQDYQRTRVRALKASRAWVASVPILKRRPR